MKYLLNVAVLVGLAVYGAAFFAVPLPDLAARTGEPLQRWQLLVQIILLPEDWLFAAWFGNPMSFSLLDRLPVLLVAGGILAWAYLLGWLIVGFFEGVGSRRRAEPENNRTREAPPASQPPIKLTRLETFVFSMGAGLAALGAWTLIMGLFGVLDRVWTVAVPGAATLLATLWVRFRVAASRPFALPEAAEAAIQQPARQTEEMLGPRWLWLAAPFAAAIVLAAMLPPVDFDVREYHLQAPKEFYQQGRITFLPHNVYANMPLGAEMLALLTMVISGDWWLGALAGKTAIAAFTPLCALGLYAAGRRFFSTTAGVAAALAYISIPWVVGLSASGLIEAATACYTLLAVYALLLRGGRTIFLAGFFAGAAVATKYPAALFVLVPMGVWVVVNGFANRDSACLAADGTSASKRKNDKRDSAAVPVAAKQTRRFPIAAKRLTLFLLAATVCGGPWFVKNWAFTGNPTYPLLYEAFGGKTWNEEKNRRWNEVHRPKEFSPDTLGKDLGSVAMTSQWISPLIVPLAALALLGLFGAAGPPAAWRPIVWPLFAYFAFVIAAWWLFTHRIDRFWFPVLPVMALLAGAGACWSAARWWRGLLRAMIIFGLTANFLVAASAVWYNAWFVPLHFLRDDPRLIDPWHWRLDVRSTGGTILTVGDAAVFDFHSPVLYSTCFDDCVFERLVEGKTSSEVLAELRSRDIEFIYVSWGEIARYRSKGNYGFTDFVQPEVFDRLVEDEVLEPLPPINGFSGRAYRVAK